MIFLSSGQSWQQQLALGQFSLTHFVTEIQIPYFLFASLQTNDPCNKDTLLRSGFSKQINRNSTAKTLDQELSLKGKRMLGLYLFFFLLSWGCCHVLLQRSSIGYYFICQERKPSALFPVDVIWGFLRHYAYLQKQCKVVYKYAYKKQAVSRYPWPGRVTYSVLKIYLYVAVLKNLINLSTTDTATEKSELLQVWDNWIPVMYPKYMPHIIWDAQ